MKTRRIFFFLLIFLAGSAAADEATTYFVQGNKAYEAGDFAGAIASYEKIIDLKKENWQLYFNLGNAYFRSNDIGKAVLNYERALKLAPENEDVQFNLEMALLQTTDRIPTPPKEAWLLALEKLFYVPSFSLLLYLSLVLYATFLLVWALRYLFPLITGLPFYRFLLTTVFIAFILSGSIFSLRWYDQVTKKYGVIVQPAVKVTSSPTAEATEIFVLHAGTKFQIQEETANWLRIRLRDGKTGWISAETAGRI